MKKFLFTAIIALLLASCSGESVSDSPNIEYYPAKASDSDLWGLVGPNGEFLFEDEFENEPQPAIDGIFAVYENEAYSIYTATEKPKCLISGLTEVGYMSNGLMAIVRPNSRIEWVDKEGKTKFTLDPIKGHEVIHCSKDITNDLIVVETDDSKWGAVNTKGETVIAPKYDSLQSFSEGLAIAGIKKNDEYTYYIIDKEGKEVAKLNPDITTSGSFKYGKCVAYRSANDKSTCGFINTKGEFTKLPGKASAVLAYNNDYIVFMNQENQYKCGIMNYDGEILVRDKYNSIATVKDGEMYICYLDNNKTELLNSKFEVIEKYTDTQLIALMGRDFYLLSTENKYSMLLNKDLKQVGKNEFAAFDAFFYGYEEDNMITSYYFPAQTVAKQIVEQISTDGVGKVKFGTDAKTFLGNQNPRYYAYKTYASNGDVLEYSPFYYYMADVYFNGNIAQYDYYNLSRDYSFTPAKIYKVQLNITLKSKEAADELYKYLGQELATKSWKPDDKGTDKDKTAYVKDNCGVKIVKNNTGIELTVATAPAARSDEYVVVEDYDYDYDGGYVW